MEADFAALLGDWLRSRFFGKYRGTVVSNEDDTHRGRLKVKVPAVLGALELWAMPCVPYAGPDVGFLALPPSGAGVWVEFEGGDPSFPIWVGCFWANGEAPEEAKASLKIWKTPGAVVRIDDEAGELSMDNGSARIELADGVTTEAGQAKHEVGAGGVVSQQGQRKVEVTTASVRVNDGVVEVV
jgi:uncharacterized protein involved in type VI secretion and phage assembly